MLPILFSPAIERATNIAHQYFASDSSSSTSTEQDTSGNHRGNADTVTLSNTSEPSPQNTSWLTNLIRQTVDFFRGAWRERRKYNPVTLLFNFVEESTAAPLIERARTRNGAVTNDDIAAYHRSIEHNSSNNPNAIFCLHRASCEPADGSQRRLIVISNGHTCGFDTGGINDLTNRFLSEGHDVMVVRSGLVRDEFANRGGIPLPLHPKVVEIHVGNLVSDAYNRSGSFNREYSNVSFLCYSFGAGQVQNNIQRWTSDNVPINSTVYIDGVINSGHKLADPISERPSHRGRHYVAYQRNSYFVNGARPHRVRQGDVTQFIDEENTFHSNIANHLGVLNSAYNFIMSRD